MRDEEKKPKRSTWKAEEMRWLAENRAYLEETYPGKYIAVDGSRLVAVGDSMREVHDAAKREGIEDPLLTGVKAKEYQGVPHETFPGLEMPPNTDYDLSYDIIPTIPVRIISHSTQSELAIEALLDAGSDITIFDAVVADDLNIDLANCPLTRFQGIGGQLLEAPTIELELLPLFEPGLSVVVSVAFAPRIILSIGNLIGRDVLEYLDFAITHSTRVGYLGRTEALP